MLNNASLADEWNNFAEKASQERDPKQLLVFINGLCDILEMEGSAPKRVQVSQKY